MPLAKDLLAVSIVKLEIELILIALRQFDFDLQLSLLHHEGMQKGDLRQFDTTLILRHDPLRHGAHQFQLHGCR